MDKISSAIFQMIATPCIFFGVFVVLFVCKVSCDEEDLAARIFVYKVRNFVVFVAIIDLLIYLFIGACIHFSRRILLLLSRVKSLR